MKALAIILNVFFPGVGTLVAKKWVQGIVQLLLTFLAFVLCIFGITAIVGLPLGFGVWLWGILCVAIEAKQPAAVLAEPAGQN